VTTHRHRHIVTWNLHLVNFFSIQNIRLAKQ
jgi:hypothetical protein